MRHSVLARAVLRTHIGLMLSSLSSIAPAGHVLTPDQARDLVARAINSADFTGKKVLVIVPDGTRTCPLGMVFKAVHEIIGGVTKALDVMIALGTHVAMTDDAIAERLELSPSERN